MKGATGHGTEARDEDGTGAGGGGGGGASNGSTNRGLETLRLEPRYVFFKHFLLFLYSTNCFLPTALLHVRKGSRHVKTRLDIDFGPRRDRRRVKTRLDRDMGP